MAEKTFKVRSQYVKTKLMLYLNERNRAGKSAPVMSPTYQQVEEWLLDEYGLMISINPGFYGAECKLKWDFNVTKIDKDRRRLSYPDVPVDMIYDDYYECRDNAFEWVVMNLID